MRQQLRPVADKNPTALAVPVQSAELRGFAGQLGRLIWRFNVARR
jgi:hypothetical protein